MKEDEDASLRQLAAAILDGTSIDWPSAEMDSVDESVRRVVRELKVIADIAEVHDDLPLLEGRHDISPSETQPTWSSLRLLEKVGEGTYGQVYRAWDPRLEREVALKLLRPRDPDAARAASVVVDEGRMLAQVRHPNVVTVHGADRCAGRIGLWMEFIHGRTLDRVLRERGPLAWPEAMEVGLHLCRALSAVHRAGLLHRDINAHNVMLEDGGRIVLMDFGTGVDSDDLPRGFVGTPLYMAPEVLRGDEASVQSDIYSAGVLLYHLVTGSYPVKGRSLSEVSDAHARGERTSLRDARPDLPESIVQSVERAIAPGPDARYENADTMEAALAAATHIDEQQTAAVRPRTWSRRYAALTACFLVVVAIGSRWLTVGRSDAPVIAVLPFENLSTEPDSDYFVDGLTDEIIGNLAVIDGLQVRSQTSSFAFRDKPRNVRDVGEQLGVNLIVEGSVLRSGNRLRVNAQLVQVAGDVPLWSEQFDRELKDVFAIQEEISRAIVNKLRLTLGRGQRRYDGDVATYDLYLKGRVLVGRRGIPNVQQAAKLFEQVLVRDPMFAPAHAGLANAYALMSQPTVSLPFETAYSIMQPAALKARELDPLLAEAHAAMGWVYSYERDWANAEIAFRRAIELNPSLTEVYTSYSISTLRPLGKQDEALRLLRVALRNDPLSLDALREIGEVQIEAGRYEDAIDTLRRAYDVDPDFPFVADFLSRALMYGGRLSEAIQLMEKLDRRNLGQFKPPGTRRTARLALAYLMAGRRSEAEEVAAEHADTPAYAASYYALLGDKDRAFRELEQMAVTSPHRIGRVLMQPEMARLRGDARLASLRRRFGLP